MASLVFIVMEDFPLPAILFAEFFAQIFRSKLDEPPTA